MRLNIPMIARGVRRLLAGHHVDLRSLASRTWTLCAAEYADCPPAIYLPGAIERVRQLSPWRTWEVEKQLIDGGRAEHAPSVGYSVRNVDLVGSHLYAGAARSNPGFGPERMVCTSLPPRQRIDEAVLVTNNSGSHFFGNRLLDDFPLELLAEGQATRLQMHTRPYGHEPGYRRLLGLPETPVTRHARIGELTFFVDFAQNSSKAERYAELRRRLRNALPRPAAPPHGVFIRRGPDGEPRHLANTDELEAALLARGIVTLDTSRLSAEEIARASLDARVIVAVEGSHLSHAIYSAAESATFLVLQPPDRFAMAYKEYTDRVGMRFAFVVGHPAAEGFTIDVNELNRLLDRIDTHAE